MPACTYEEEISSAAMLAVERLAGVAPEVNLRECVAYTFTKRRCHCMSKTGVSVAPQKGVSSKKFLKKQKKNNTQNIYFQTFYYENCTKKLISKQQ